MPDMENVVQLFYKGTIGNILIVFKEFIMGWKHVSELEILIPPPSKKRVGKIDEVKNANLYLIRNHI